MIVSFVALEWYTSGLSLRQAPPFFDQRALQFHVSGHSFIIIAGRIFDDARDFIAHSAFDGAKGWRIYTGGQFEVHESRLLSLRIKERIRNFQNRTAKSERERKRLRRRVSGGRLAKAQSPRQRDFPFGCGGYGCRMTLLGAAAFRRMKTQTQFLLRQADLLSALKKQL